ncbi:MAG: response regulator [Legionellaceae bacterium]|nr:response regulator [Legionellaceae bacterium]
MINVIIVDDHALVRMGIRRLLEDMPDITVMAEAGGGELALTLVKQHKPDIVLLDMKMPGMDGWEVTRRLKRTAPKVRVIAVTALSADTLPVRLLQLGAMGYLTKESGAAEMATAIRKVAQGERYVSVEMAQKIAINSVDPHRQSPFDGLSERELQITRLLTNGLTLQTISGMLFLSNKTVSGHRQRIFEKLRIKTDVELLFMAIEFGLVESPTYVSAG